jgi:hypothetical protein
MNGISGVLAYVLPEDRPNMRKFRRMNDNFTIVRKLLASFSKRVAILATIGIVATTYNATFCCPHRRREMVKGWGLLWPPSRSRAQHPTARSARRQRTISAYPGRGAPGGASFYNELRITNFV